jgi:flagellar biosynthetic protein FlhB
MAEDSDQEKTEEPSAHKIEESRKKGEVASSKELTSVLVLAGSVLTLTLSIVFIYEVLNEYLRWLYSLEVQKAFTPEYQKLILSKGVVAALKCVGPIFLASFTLGIFANVMQFGLLFAPEVLELKWDRLDPIQGFKKLFSMRSVVEAIKGIFKFLVILSIVYFFLKDSMGTYQGFLHIDFVNSVFYGKAFLTKLGFAIVTGMLIIAIFDFMYQKYAYRKKMMMSKEEAKREHKEQEGNPEVKQKIKMIQREMSQKRMMTDIPSADVIVTNPTHLSIAIKYDPETMVAPTVIGKGADHVALRIRTIAKEHDIPIVENVPLARSMYKTVKIGEGVPRNLYKAVAEILAFVYKLRRKKKALSSGVESTL